MNKFAKGSAVLSTCTLCAITSDIAYGEKLEEILVTAERRETTNLQDTPIAVSAITSEDLERLHIASLDDIDINVPGLAINSNIASSTALAVVLRGSSEPNAAFLFSEPGVGLYLNGVYRRLSAGNIELADIERVEVSRGPQGALFGRNTLAGAINVVTRKPEGELYGDISANYDNFETVSIKGVIGGSITDSLALSISGLHKDRNKGPYTNLFNGEDVGKQTYKGLQGNLVWHFGNDGELFVTAYTTKDENDGVYGSAIDITTGEIIIATPDVYAAASVTEGLLPFSSAEQDGLDAILTLPLNDALSFKYLSSYNETNSAWAVDFSAGTAASGCLPNCFIPGFFRISDGEQEQSSHEFQLLGSADQLNWIGGLYYFEEETLQWLQDEFFGVQSPQASYDLDSESIAIFGEATYSVTHSLALTIGGRYTKDEKQLSGNIGGSPYSTNQDWSRFTKKAAINYQIIDDLMVYFSYADGFKSGTFNPFADASTIVNALEPEEVDSYELGVKSTLLDNTLRINAALYNADYKDLLVGGVSVDGGLATLNGGEVAVRGLELETTWVARDWFNSFLTLNYLFDNEWDDTRGSITTRVGDALPATRELQWTLGGNFTIALADLGSVEISATIQYDDAFYSIANHQNNPIEQVADRRFYNLGVSFTSSDGAHKVWLNGKNITDEKNYFRVANFTFLPTNTAFVAGYEPASYQLGYKFSF